MLALSDVKVDMNGLGGQGLGWTRVWVEEDLHGWTIGWLDNWMACKSASLMVQAGGLQVWCGGCGGIMGRCCGEGFETKYWARESFPKRPF